MQTNEANTVDLVKRAAFAVTGRELLELTLDTHLSSTGVDSVGILEMAAWIEDALGVRLPDEEIARITTVRDLDTAIERARKAAANE